VLLCRRTTSATGDLRLVSQQARAAGASHVAATAQVGTSAKGGCRSKSAVCCDNTEVGGFMDHRGLGSRRCAASETATVSEELRLEDSPCY
jgi:hypothetical protein